MKANKLMLVAFVLMSNLTFSQTKIEEVTFWNKKIAGFPISELIISVIAVLAIVFIAYRMSIVKSK